MSHAACGGKFLNDDKIGVIKCDKMRKKTGNTICKNGYENAQNIFGKRIRKHIRYMYIPFFKTMPTAGPGIF